MNAVINRLTPIRYHSIIFNGWTTLEEVFKLLRPKTDNPPRGILEPTFTGPVGDYKDFVRAKGLKITQHIRP